MERARGYYGTVAKLAESLPAPTDAKNSLIVTIGSDRGLCGAINSSITKHVKPLIKEQETKGQKVNVICIGEKIPGQLARDYGSRINFSVTETSKKSMSYLAASLIADRILQSEFDKGTLFFNKFNTVISYTTTQQNLASPTAVGMNCNFT
jgi:F-type H+-transporting ATPase subunit gamma